MQTSSSPKICFLNPQMCVLHIYAAADDEDADLAAAIAASMEQHSGQPAAAAAGGDGGGSSYAAVAAAGRQQQQQQWGSAGDLAGAAEGDCWERPMFDDPFNSTSTLLALVPSVLCTPLLWALQC
jgi:hypothetical protein